MTDDNPVQCVEVTIVNDIEDEDEMECFALSISPLTSTDGVTLDTTHATICITDDDGEFFSRVGGVYYTLLGKIHVFSTSFFY